jgi:DNA-binding MarR family transcriptional regulator/N-acetylglutamate synthase-like GNAT family acetyltransferase
LDYLEELGELAFGSRLRRLVKRTDADVARVYRELGVDVQPRWFPLLFILKHEKSMSITAAANALHFSHTAINKLARQMISKGLVGSETDPTDGRKRLLSLTAKGRQTITVLKPVWESIHHITKELVDSTEHNILLAVKEIEEVLDQCSVYRRVRESMRQYYRDRIEIIDYTPRLRQHFESLNREWLEKYFRVEELDARLLSRPYQEIVKKGGAVLFARLDGRVVGTAALIRHEDGVLELAKMAVTQSARRRMVGTRLTEAILQRVRDLGGTELYLETHRKLQPANSLYQRMDFVRVESEVLPKKYKRGRIVMRRRV